MFGVSDFASDLRYAARQFSRQKALFAIAVLRPLPYPEADRLIFLHNLFPGSQTPSEDVSGYDYAEIKRQNK